MGGGKKEKRATKKRGRTKGSREGEADPTEPVAGKTRKGGRRRATDRTLGKAQPGNSFLGCRGQGDTSRGEGKR